MTAEDELYEQSAEDIRESMRTIINLVTLKGEGPAAVAGFMADRHDDDALYAGALLVWQAFNFVGAPDYFPRLAQALAEIDYMILRPRDED